MQTGSGKNPLPDLKVISEQTVPILEPGASPKLKPLVARINTRAISCFLQATPMSADIRSEEADDREPSGRGISDFPSSVRVCSFVQEDGGSGHGLPLTANFPAVRFGQAPVTTEPVMAAYERTGLVRVADHRPDTARSLPANPIAT